MNNQESLKINRKFIFEKRSFFSKYCLPFILMVSFLWINLYDILSDLYDVFFINESYATFGSLTLSVVVLGLFEYLMFEICFLLYRVFIGFSIYSYVIPKNVLLDKFRSWYIVRNMILGCFLNLRFFFPFINTYLIILEIILDFAFLFCLYYSLKKNYVEPLIGQHIFRSLALPILIYEAYVVITQVVGVLW